MATAYQSLIEAAAAARAQSYAPYSKLRVGAALLCADGTVFSGANVENASYGLSLCAERVALFSAIAAGKRQFLAVAIVYDDTDPARPCGACRQALREFGGDIEVVMASVKGNPRVMKLRDLLPESFGPDQL